MKQSTCEECYGLDDESAECEHCDGTGYEPEVEDSPRVKAAKKLLDDVRKYGILGGGF
jgi:hypothetical protein